MQFLIIILILCFIIFLFGLHVLAKEDLVFVRKNVTIELLFNLAFYTAGVGLLFARIVYVILHPSSGFLNPLVFLLFPYFPGLSLIGGVVGGILFLLFYKRKKFPTGRIFDFFSMALLGALPFGFFGAELLRGMTDIFAGIFMPILLFFTLIFFVKVLLPLNNRGELKDGSLGLLVLIIMSFTLFLTKIVHERNDMLVLLQIDTILLVVVFAAALTLLVLQERDVTHIKM
ncbi:MAG: prolipoprotein diacylglyceryl transferase [Candidatus Levybacteria bacterium]|nr:prolipoprotein diacylglyceryl transferase [Candidatus Levybacteria bacterium]